MSNKNDTIFGISIPKFSYSNLKGRYRDSWIEDSFSFEQKYGRQPALSGSKNYIGSSFSIQKKKIFIILVFGVFLLLMGRVFFIQIVQGKSYTILAENNSQRTIPVPAERGIIYDRNGQQLTKNVLKFSLSIVPQDLPRKAEELEKIVVRLAELTQKDEEDIRNIIKEYGAYSYESIDIMDDLDYETALSIQIETSDLPGITIEKRSKRLYLMKDEEGEKLFSLAHLLGYAGKLNPDELAELYTKGYLPTDTIGKMGIEKTYEEALRGKYGYQKIQVNAFGRKQSILAEKAPILGKHVQLSVDVEIQNKLEEIMSRYLKNKEKEKAAAVVMDPRNGEILASVSLPAFDNNDFSGGISLEKYQEYLNNKNNPLFNRVISGTYPSGSTIKMAIAMAALQEGIITKTTSFLSTGGIQVGSWFFGDWKYGGHGITNVQKSLAWSVNTFYYYIGGGYNDFQGLGVGKIVEYLKKFGFAKKLGIDIPGEVDGFLPSKEWKQEAKNESWYVGDTYNLSIGQGDVLVTPLQIASLTSVVANGGTLYQPKIAQKIVDPETKEEAEVKTTILNEHFINLSNVQTVQLGMRECVVYGSCRRLSSLPMMVAGKTGTAQWSSTKDNHAWFTSFAPFNNPEIVVTVLIEEGEEGSGISAEIAYDFYKWWYEYRF
ncbi:MAG: penicillin-binding protein 2 [Candidatus Magasanikbacteria bacterium CG_4_9_14_3_um_filter_32_9]|uniref:Penicillin-binding protein 2 n=1 Tax=Candidatus Magasanikbacteria bacterium CG_4_9_14_3_um_filter_32_9 TaxID=1974644 RepID=A0A2M7Z6M8_9BACT|nr:MAG: penicillin-binding protein 2 [Candidatus Magasanikbacteria bacterium CG_4_9_14_3_um_filter_32_9]